MKVILAILVFSTFTIPALLHVGGANFFGNMQLIFEGTILGFVVIKL